MQRKQRSKLMDKILGIVNLESSGVHVEGIEDYRPVSAASFLGRYRVLDFMISNMTNSKVNNIQVYIKNRPRSTIDHITGTNYNINTKKGHIQILHGEKAFSSEVYNTDIANFLANKEFIEESDAPYVVIAPSHFVYIQDFNALLEHHVETKADVTIMYQSVSNAKEAFNNCDTLELGENKEVKAIEKNRGKYKNRDISLECYCMSRSLLLDLMEKARKTSSLYWLSDIIADSVDELKVMPYQHKGYAACINSLKAYYDANLELSDYYTLKGLINDDWPIFTKTNDTCPTLYKEGAKIQGSLVGNGCIIEGEVINSVIGRNCVIKKGAVVKDSVILPSSLVNRGAKIENAVIDRYAIISHIKELKGDKDKPIYVKRRDRI